MTEASLIDTNVLVYRYDPRFPDKQDQANRLLRSLAEARTGRLAHQVLVEFVAATTRKLGNVDSLLELPEALREAEELMRFFPVLYPTDAVLRLAFRGCMTYQLSWFDAHLWACAEHYGIPRIVSEDFQHGRFYGTVVIDNPFLGSA